MTIQAVLHRIHAEAVIAREAAMQCVTGRSDEYTAWAEDPTQFLQRLVGSRADVFVRPDYKPFYTMEPTASTGRRRYWAKIPPPHPVV